MSKPVVRLTLHCGTQIATSLGSTGQFQAFHSHRLGRRKYAVQVLRITISGHQCDLGSVDLCQPHIWKGKE